MDRINQSTILRGRPVTSSNAAHANEYFEHFLNASTLKTILGYYRNICDLLHLKPNVYPQFYPKLRANLTSWRAKALWKKFDARSSHKCYGKGKTCPNTRVLIIGAGPCGLRTAIEAQLLGAKVVVVEKRDRMSRNNVLHLWPFVIEDLRALGAKKFFGKFCAGSIDHISIRQLQCILLKAALLLGVEVHTEVSFERLVEPNPAEKTGWRAECKPLNHPVSQYEFDVIIGADGKRNTLQGFKRKEFRGKLAIAITANFINKRTEAEAIVEEISGVAFIFNQKFFKDLYAETGIDLENIVYYKDDTHYFVMTAKKPSLIDKGVIKQDLADTERLLAPDNVNREALMNYAREAAEFSTNYQLPDLEFAVNHYGQPDVAMFDFTSMYAAENASKIVERHGYKLLMILVGDSLLEPFWPTGSGCARGFLSSLDAAWAIRSWGSGVTNPLEVLAERESIYRLLAQTTPDNLNKDWKAYTLDPVTRYPNLNKNVVLPHQTLTLYDTDNPKNLERLRRNSQDLMLTKTELPRKRRREEIDNEVLVNWIKEQVKEHEDITVTDIGSVFKDGRVLCAVINRYRPDLLDYSAINRDEPATNNQIAFDVLEKELGIVPVMTGEEMTKTDDYLTMASYLTQVYDMFRCEIPHIKHPKLEKVSSKKTIELPLPVTKAFPKESFLPKYVLKSSRSNNNASKQIVKPIKANKYFPRKTPFDFWLQNNKPSFTNKLILTPVKSIEEHLDNTNKKKPIEISNICKHKILIIKEPQKPNKSFMKESNLCTFRSSKSETMISTESASKYRFYDENFREFTPDSILKRKLLKAHKKRHLKKVKIRMIEDNVYNVRKIKEFDFNCRSNVLSVKPEKYSEIVQHDVPPLLRDLKNEAIAGELSKNKRKRQVGFRSHVLNLDEFKFLFSSNMSDKIDQPPLPDQAYDRVIDWLNVNDFQKDDQEEKCCCDKNKPLQVETNIIEGMTDITSITKNMGSSEKNRKNIVVDKETHVVSCEGGPNNQTLNSTPKTSQENFTAIISNFKLNNVVKTLSKFTTYAPCQNYTQKIMGEGAKQIPVIMESEESELPESKRHETTFPSKFHYTPSKSVMPQSLQQPVRPSSRHKRHVDAMTQNKPAIVPDRKTRKRRTLEKVGASVGYLLGCATGELPRRQVSHYITSIEERQKCLEDIIANRNDRQSKRRQQRKLQTDNFIKSMQMLQANAKPDHSEPFEDYSIFLYRQTAPNFEDRVKDLERKFTYIPDRENKLPAQSRGEKDEDFVARIKDLEDKWKEPVYTEKKPKDLLRAIGKIETSDWNIKEIEKKIMENKMGKAVNKDKEKVPKWSREQFLARQTKMEKQHLDRQDSAEAKYAVIDKNIKQLEQKLKEGTARDLGQNKVASITEKFVNKNTTENEPKPLQKSNSKVILPTQGGSEYCHFCNKRVYLMERLSAEGRFFHHGCFRCQYCNTQLRLGSYSFDRDGQFGHKFFCVHHYGMQGELYNNKVTRKVSQRLTKSPDKKPFGGVTGLDLLDRVQTPERIEFSNLNENASSDHEESPSQMDEDEWTDRNFGASTAELGSSDDESSSLSETDSDDEDAYEEALEEPVTKEGTLKWAERWKQRYLKKRNDSGSDGYSSSDQSSYYENSSEDDDSETATEGEEEIRARELRKQEVRVKPPVIHTDTGTDTEIASDESTSESSSEIHNSATEISTDSEFAHDDPTPTSELPSLTFNDFYVTKTRGRYGGPKKIQVTSGFIQKSNNGRTAQKQDIELKLTPLVPSPSVIRKPAPSLLPRNEGYALNRTQSTGGIAARVSLELKKKYLLGEGTVAGNIQKSGSASTLDTKLKSFHTNISDCQKLLKPASDTNTNMQLFGNKLNEILAAQLKKTKENEEKDTCNPVIEIIKSDDNEEKTPTDLPQVVNECEGRPRSPLHEASIIVPQIDWSKHKKEEDFADSLTESEDLAEDKPPVNIFVNIPRVEVHDANGEILHDDMTMDSLCIEPNKPPSSLTSETKSFTSEKDPKSITSEKKSLNQPKILPNLEYEMPDIHIASHMKPNKKPSQESASGRSSPSNSDSCAEQVTAALTETELSDWARDGAVSDDFEDVEFELNPDLISARKHKKPKNVKLPKATEAINIAKIGEFDDMVHVCGKDNRKISITETFNNVLNPDLENIEFMDTGTETSSDDGISNGNDGYVQLKNEDDMAEDSLSPTINQYIDKNLEKNTGFCIIANESNNFGSEVIDLKPNDLFKAKQRLNVCEHEEDSLLIVDAGTTTEENTCSDSTVKNVTTKESKEETNFKLENTKRQELENRLAKVKEEHAAIEEAINKTRSEKLSKNDYEEHCHRLQSKVEFSNVKDSIDIRKSRRKSKSDSPPKPDLIQEENCPPKDITLNLTAAIRTPTTFYKKEEIQKERDLNQKLIQEMVMNKMKAQNKSLERKKRNRNSFSPNRPFELTKSATTDISMQLNNTGDTNCSIYATPDVIIPAINKSHPLQKSVTTSDLNRTNESFNSSNEIFTTPIGDFKRPLSLYTDSYGNKQSETHVNNPSLPDLQKALFQDSFKTPVAPPRQKHEDAKKTVEKLKQNARARARLLSNEELGLSPEDKLEKLREKISRREKENIDIQDSIESLVINTERRNSLLYSNDTLSKKRNNSFKRSKSGGDASPIGDKIEPKLSILKSAECPERPTRTKSVSEITKNLQNSTTPPPAEEHKLQYCKSDPNLLEDLDKGSKKKWKERERKFSKLFTTFFMKKKEMVANATPTSSRGFLSRISPKARAKSKEDNMEKVSVRRQSFSETICPSRSSGDVSPPPIPPLPINYTGSSRLQGDESSDGENDWKHQSSCDTLDQSGLYDGSTSSLASRKTNRSARKAIRHAHLKRHRMAQEIQRKLEETEVKTRELEQRGVSVEKALRGETSGDVKDESELLQEWFDLMRDRTELRRYEKELMIRAQELELEDRHARLQHELRERLEKDDQKSKYDAEIERSIIDEMMEIVKKRDSLIALLEEDRISFQEVEGGQLIGEKVLNLGNALTLGYFMWYSEEDRDFEEQMLAKGLRLTPIRKTPEK